MLTLSGRAEARPSVSDYLHFPAAARALLSLDPDGCRWPLGDPSTEGFRFCAALRQSRATYCAPHLGLACEAVR